MVLVPIHIGNTCCNINTFSISKHAILVTLHASKMCINNRFARCSQKNKVSAPNHAHFVCVSNRTCFPSKMFRKTTAMHLDCLHYCGKAVHTFLRLSHSHIHMPTLTKICSTFCSKLRFSVYFFPSERQYHQTG